MKLNAAKAGFFDRVKVMNAVDKATRGVLSKFGAFVRQRAKTSIRPRKGTSPPGLPPYSHTGLLRRFIFFSYDNERHSVVIGPTLINTPTGAPETLEHGGATTILDRRRRKRVTIQPRPYMGPAFEAEKAQLPSLWRNSVR
jgi:hypothetical protein